MTGITLRESLGIKSIRVTTVGTFYPLTLKGATKTALAPFVARVAEVVADYHYYKNRPREAAQFYRKSIEADRTRETPWIGLLRSLKLLGAKKELEEAKNEYQRKPLKK